MRYCAEKVLWWWWWWWQENRKYVLFHSLDVCNMKRYLITAEHILFLPTTLDSRGVVNILQFPPSEFHFNSQKYIASFHSKFLKRPFYSWLRLLSPTFEFYSISSFSDFSLVNKSLPWDYDFRFVIEEINNINDKAQVTGLSWLSKLSNIFHDINKSSKKLKL